MYSVHIFSSLVFIAILSVVILSYYKTKSFEKRNNYSGEHFNILKKRYAKGEITKEER